MHKANATANVLDNSLAQTVDQLSLLAQELKDQTVVFVKMEPLRSFLGMEYVHANVLLILMDHLCLVELIASLQTHVQGHNMGHIISHA